jgi:hypothetical protein
VQNIFNHLFKQLCLHKPDDPLNFLINELRTKRKKRLIFLSSFSKQYGEKIAASLSARLNFKHISYQSLVKDEVLSGSDSGKKFAN